jgi:hypothetical protein
VDPADDVHHHLKADLMNVRARWAGVSVGEIAERCRTLGMREEDVAEVASLVKKAQEGRRLVPEKTYRNFRFNPPVVEPTTVISGDGDGDRHALAGRASSAPRANHLR